MKHTIETSEGVTIWRRIDSKYAAVLIENRVEIINITTGQVLPHDEPLMLFRGKDWLGRRLIRFYQELCQANKCSHEHVAGIGTELGKFEQFAQEQPQRMKTPD